ncbi:hypothetical protein PAB09_08885 [Corynebacterium sp. SCR221107]|uniref:hypothetical protein n=1 Tax=Corynebacterium sp. SCR221107 TaxID=3017361 RepID=UPI0022EC3664|nr:hypothetical protein [Corynebacterium sp. SCR221107]WBT08018.1 hypothetical protein PAB09_08885 [Corynebacterium sp. SCR221107]
MTMTHGSNRDSLRRSHVSRDYSRHPQQASTVVTRRPPRSDARGATSTTTPQRQGERALVPPGRRRFQHRPGSQQQISNRGRRVADAKKAVDPHRVRMLIGVLAFISFGVFMAMMISGWTTAQTFTIKDLNNQESVLDNQIETLNRDLQNASSSAEIARRAAEMGLVVPDQPGILEVGENGDTSEQRPAGDVTRPIVDVNGQQITASAVSSDPAKTQEVTSNLNPLPNTGTTSSNGDVASNAAPVAGTTGATNDSGTTIAPYAAR